MARLKGLIEPSSSEHSLSAWESETLSFASSQFPGFIFRTINEGGNLWTLFNVNFFFQLLPDWFYIKPRINVLKEIQCFPSFFCWRGLMDWWGVLYHHKLHQFKLPRLSTILDISDDIHISIRMTKLAETYFSSSIFC